MANSDGTKKQRGSKKGRKYNRNRVKCKLYRTRVHKPHHEGNKRGKHRSS